MAKVTRRYAASLLILLVISTATTAANWILARRPPVDVLVLQGPDLLFASVEHERTVSTAVRSLRNLKNLEFRFSCLLERPVPPGVVDRIWVDSEAELLQASPAVSCRLSYFSAVGAADFVTVRWVTSSNRKDYKILLVDFRDVYSAIASPQHTNESLTVFAFVINASGHVVGYYEGYSDLFTAKEHLLDLVRIESGSVTREYLPSPGGELCIARDLPAFGSISFTDARRGRIFGVTLLIKKWLTEVPKDAYETKIATTRFLEVVETFAEGEWVREASGYWLIWNGRTGE